MARRVGTASFAKMLGRRLTALRLEAGLTQEKLAYETDLAKGHLSMIEAGKRLPSLAVLVALAERLEVEPADVLAFDLEVPRFRILDLLRRGDQAEARRALRELGSVK